MPQLQQLAAQLDRPAAFEPGPFPVVSLYLNLRPNEYGKDRVEPFLRKEVSERIHTYEATTPERKSLEADVEKIGKYVASVDASVNSVAIFACSGADLFETVALAAPIDAHRLFIASLPHLSPSAHVLDEYPRYLAAVYRYNPALSPLMTE